MSDGSAPTRPDNISWDIVPRDVDSDDLGSTDLLIASQVCDLVDWLVENDRYRILDARVLEDLYSGRWVTADDLSFGVSAYAEAGGDPVKLNFARNAVDFVYTKVASVVPSVEVTARGGGYAQERRADLLDRYVDRIVDSSKLDDLARSAALHALRTGAAVIKTHGVSGVPNAELVPAEWVFVDREEARNGDPRSIYERRPVPKRYLLDRFCPEWRDRDDDREPSDLEHAIRNAPAAQDPLNVGLASGVTSAVELVDVYEGWALPDDRPDSPPGRHVIAVRGGALLVEDWTFPRFPHAIFGVDPPAAGRGGLLHSQGLLCQVDEAQAEIDFLLAQVSEQIRLARLKVFVPSDDTVLSEDLLASSAQGQIVPYDRNAGPPTFSTPPTVSREAIEHIQWLVKELYEVAGMSEQAASSQRPAGVNSGRAIEFFHDYQTKRFYDLVARFGTFYASCVDRLLDRAEELHAPVDDGDGSDGDGTGEEPTGDDGLSWSQVRMDRRDFVISLEQVSSVPRTYAGRMQRIEQMIAQGMIPPGYWADYIRDPNAWRAEHRAASQSEHLDWLMSELEDEARPVPELSDKLDMALATEVLTGEVLTLIRKGADREIIDRVEDFLDLVVQAQKRLQGQAAAEQAAMQPPTGASPGAPQSAPLAPQQQGGLAPKAQ